MLRAPLDEEIAFEVKLESIQAEDKNGKDLKNEKGWSIYLAKFRNVTDGDEFQAEDGQDEVPFHMMSEFADWIEQQGNKGWVSGVFVRSTHPKGSEGEFVDA